MPAAMLSDVHTAALSADDRALVGRSCAALGLEPPREISTLTTGRSGALVVSLRSAERSMVLKITTDEARRERARKEVRVLARTRAQFGRAQPAVITSGHGTGWVAVAFEEYRPIESAVLLGLDDWLAIASALASIHRPPTAPIPELSRRPWPDPAEVAGSVRHWFDLGSEQDARRGLRLLDRPARAGPDLPVVLVHGDCHLENIVRDDGGYRWIDWQEAGLDDGLGDLVFLWQRAEFAGASPPREAMLTAYARVRGLDPAELAAVGDRHELRLLLHAWGPFLSYGSPSGRAVLEHRLAELSGG